MDTIESERIYLYATNDFIIVIARPMDALINIAVYIDTISLKSKQNLILNKKIINLFCLI